MLANVIKWIDDGYSSPKIRSIRNGYTQVDAGYETILAVLLAVAQLRTGWLDGRRCALRYAAQSGSSRRALTRPVAIAPGFIACCRHERRPHCTT
jgi:hypothetical protein